MKYETKVYRVYKDEFAADLKEAGKMGWEVKAGITVTVDNYLILQRPLYEICKNCQHDERHHDPTTGKCYYGSSLLDLP